MTTQEVANQWYSFCKEGQNIKCIEALYADDIKSTEMNGMPDQMVSGKLNILKKNNEWFNSVEEWHSRSVKEPTVAGDHFTSKLSFDATFKGRGRISIDEIGVYQVKNGKIVREQYFYPMD